MTGWDSLCASNAHFQGLDCDAIIGSTTVAVFFAKCSVLRGIHVSCSRRLCKYYRGCLPRSNGLPSCILMRSLLASPEWFASVDVMLVSRLDRGKDMEIDRLHVGAPVCRSSG